MSDNPILVDVLLFMYSMNLLWILYLCMVVTMAWLLWQWFKRG